MRLSYELQSSDYDNRQTFYVRIGDGPGAQTIAANLPENSAGLERTFADILRLVQQYDRDERQQRAAHYRNTMWGANPIGVVADDFRRYHMDTDLSWAVNFDTGRNVLTDAAQRRIRDQLAAPSELQITRFDINPDDTVADALRYGGTITGRFSPGGNTVAGAFQATHPPAYARSLAEYVNGSIEDRNEHIFLGRDFLPHTRACYERTPHRCTCGAAVRIHESRFRRLLDYKRQYERTGRYIP